MKKIIIAEGIWKGHNKDYFRVFSKELVNLGYEVIALCPDPSAVPWAAKAIEFHRPAGVWIRPREVLSTLRYGYRLAQTLERENIPSSVPLFLPMIDLFFHAWMPESYLSDLWKRPYAGLFIVTDELRFPAPFFRNKIYRTAASAKSIAVLDEGIAHKLQEEIGVPVTSFPDFSATNAVLPKGDATFEPLRARANGRPIVTLLGDLAARKGLLPLLRFADSRQGTGYFFVISGGLPPWGFSRLELREWRRRTHSLPDNVALLGRLDNPSFNSLVKFSDVIWVAYRNFAASSNLLTKSAFFKRPVVVRKGALLEERVLQYQLGGVLPAFEKNDSPNKTDKALKDALNQVPNADFSAYAKLHDKRNIRDALQALLNDAQF